MAPSGQKRRASERFTMTTSAAGERCSSAVKVRPSTSGAPSVSKSRGEAVMRIAPGSSPRGTGWRSITSRTGAPPSSTGMLEVAATPATPGSAATRSSSWLTNSRAPLGHVVGVARDVEAHRQQRLLDEARGRRLQPQEAAHHQAGPDEQRQGRRHLAHDQERLQALRGGARPCRARRRAGRSRGPGARRASAGSRPAHERGQRP